jgi:hypothetical protein
MIQIDDAGSGSFVGGTCIGIYRPESNEYYFDIIPVVFYNRENFKKKLYLDKVVSIVSASFNLLNVSKDEDIEICQGYMFEKLKLWLDSNGYLWRSTRITGRAQEIVERNFELYTVKLGLPKQYIKYTKYPFHFHKLLRWVYADPEQRVNLCKIGWKSWEKVEGNPYELFEITTELPYLICMKCGRYIKKGSRVKVVRFFSNKENFVYLHKDCRENGTEAGSW